VPVPGEQDAAELRAAARSGLMALIGREDGPPLSPPPGLVRRMDAVARSVQQWSDRAGAAVDVGWADLVTVRARLLGMRRRGRTSANETCRLLPATDGFVAVNLARPEDRAAVAAVVEGDPAADPWTALESALATHTAAHVMARCRLLGVPAAPLGSPRAAAPACAAHPMWAPRAPRSLAELRVVDLSSMWAGPLTAHLLARAGARVVKVESASRPDGLRAVPALYRTLHDDDQPLVTLDLTSSRGRDELRRLVTEADVVIESSRPRALEQLGIAPADLDGPPGKIWIGITGYGRSDERREWVAFGDDAAVAGGLVAWEAEGAPVFCGDALADPVTGMIAAAAAFEALAGGGGVLLDVALEGCAASLAPDTPALSHPASPHADGWAVEVEGQTIPVRDRAAEAQASNTTRPATTVARTGGG